METVDALQNPKRRADFIAARHTDVIEGTAKRAALVEKAKGMRPASANGSAPSRDVDIPVPPAFGVKRLDRLPLQDLFKFFDLNTLYRLHWGAKNAKGAEYEKLVKESARRKIAGEPNQLLSALVREAVIEYLKRLEK